MRTRLTSSICSLSIVALVAATIPVTLTTHETHAQGMDADTKEAKTLFEDGVKLYREGHYEEARVKFKAAYGLKKRPSILLNLARAELQTKRPLDAAAHFRELIAMPDAKAEDRDDAKAGLADARKLLGVVAIDAPDGSTVTIDGEARGTTPMEPIDVAAGGHSFTVKAPSGKVTTEKVTLFAGQTTTMHAHGDAKAEPALVDKKPDETPTAEPPTTDKKPDTTTDSGNAYDGDDTAAKPDEPAHKVDEAPKHAGKSFFASLSPLTYIAAGVTVGAAVGWGVAYSTYSTHKTNVDNISAWLQQNQPTTPAQQTDWDNWQATGKDEVNSANSALTYSRVFMVLTIVGAGTTIASLLWMRDTGPVDGAPAAASASPGAISGLNFSAAPLAGGGGFVAFSGQF